MTSSRGQSRQTERLFPPGGIDLRSPIPLYFQLATLIGREITGGRWPAGAQIASEPELCETLGVSRITVREALSRLEQEGLITRERGKGSFVADTQRRSWLLQSSDGFAQDEVGRLGRQVSSTILSAERAPLPTWASDALDLPSGSLGVTLERLRAVDGLTALYVVNHLPIEFADAVLSMEDPQDSLYERVRRIHGMEVSDGRRVLEAVPAGETMAELLEVEPGSPLVFVESSSRDRDGRAFDCYRAWVRTDRMKIEIEVTSTASSGLAGAGAGTRGLA
jgi:GntR family transcriptional regulator